MSSFWQPRRLLYEKSRSVETEVEKGIAMMIATVKIQLNASIAMAITQFFLATLRHGRKKKQFSVKYEKSITFPEARKLVVEQFAAPGKSYASITKVAGVHVSCTDAQTQKDETCIAELKSATSNAGSKPTLAPPLSGMAQIKMGVVPSTSTQPNPAETKSTPKPAETKSAPNTKDKVDTGRTVKESDDPIKTHNRHGAFNEDDMETEITPSSPRRGIITRIPTT